MEKGVSVQLVLLLLVVLLNQIGINLEVLNFKVRVEKSVLLLA